MATLDAGEYGWKCDSGSGVWKALGALYPGTCLNCLVYMRNEKHDQKLLPLINYEGSVTIELLSAVAKKSERLLVQSA